MQAWSCDSCAPGGVHLAQSGNLRFQHTHKHARTPTHLRAAAKITCRFSQLCSAGQKLAWQQTVWAILKVDHFNFKSGRF